MSRRWQNNDGVNVMTGVTLLAQGLPPDRQTDIETQTTIMPHWLKLNIIEYQLMERH